MPIQHRPLPNVPDALRNIWVQKYWPDVTTASISPLGFGLPYLFGSGSDGDVTISANSTIAAYDVLEYRNLTIDANKTLSSTETSEGLIIIFVSERCVVNGSITMNAKGGLGASFSNSAVNYTSSYAGSGGAGGDDETPLAGGDGGDTVVSGGNGSGAGANGGNGTSIGTLNLAKLRLQSAAKDNIVVSWGAGGGGGRQSGGGGVPGAGANGGGGIILIANELTIGTNGTVTANGSNGANSTLTQGAGGGGGGGLIYIVTRRLSNSGNVTATGGSGGLAPGTGWDGGAGGNGTVIQEILPS